MNRRVFMKWTGLAVVGAAITPLAKLIPSSQPEPQPIVKTPQASKAFEAQYFAGCYTKSDMVIASELSEVTQRAMEEIAHDIAVRMDTMIRDQIMLTYR